MLRLLALTWRSDLCLERFALTWVAREGAKPAPSGLVLWSASQRVDNGMIARSTAPFRGPAATKQRPAKGSSPRTREAAVAASRGNAIRNLAY